MLRPLLGALSPAGRHARLSTLIFHRVMARPDPLFPGEVDAMRFDAICGWVRKWANVLPLEEAIQRLTEGSLPARALCITFDDGYADNHDVALPILQRHGLTATFFVASGFIDGGIMWNDRVIEAVRSCGHTTLRLPEGLIPGRDAFDMSSWTARRRAIDELLQTLKYPSLVERLQSTNALAAAAGMRLPVDLMMRTPQVAALAEAGMGVGGHTVNHPILARLGEAQALQEMQDGKRAVEAMTQRPVHLFAYPNGRPGTDYTARDVVLAQRAGFKAAVSTAWGAAHAGVDTYQLPRFTPWDQSRLRFGARLAINLRATIRPGLTTAVSP